MTEALADALRTLCKSIENRGIEVGGYENGKAALAAYDAKSSPCKPDAVRVALEALRKIEGIVDGDEWILAWGSEGRIRFHTELIERLCFDAIAALEAEGGEKPDVTPTGAVVAARSGATAGETAPDSLRALAQQGEKG